MRRDERDATSGKTGDDFVEHLLKETDEKRNIIFPAHKKIKRALESIVTQCKKIILILTKRQYTIALIKEDKLDKIGKIDAAY